MLRAEVNWTLLPRELSLAVRMFLVRCLQKDQKQRIRDIGDVFLALEGAFETGVLPTVKSIAVPQPARRALPWVAGALLGGLVSGLTVWGIMQPAPQSPAPVARFPILLTAEEEFLFTGRPIVALSPAGTHVVYTANNGLSLRPVDKLQSTPMLGTEAEARSPFFSPDGQQVGFWAAGQLKRVPLSGGAPVTVAEALNPFGASWGADNMTPLWPGSPGNLASAGHGGRTRAGDFRRGRGGGARPATPAGWRVGALYVATRRGGVVGPSPDCDALAEDR